MCRSYGALFVRLAGSTNITLLTELFRAARLRRSANMRRRIEN